MENLNEYGEPYPRELARMAPVSITLDKDLMNGFENDKQ